MSEKRSRQVAIALVVLAALLRFSGRLNSGLWYDELWTLVDFGRLELGALLTNYGSDNNHPLFSLLAWFCLRIFGEQAFALRLPAVLFGIGGVYMLYHFARSVTSEREALLATALLTLSYHHVWFSQNARGYTALLFFTMACTHMWLRILDPQRSQTVVRSTVLYGVFLALGTYTHLTAVFVAVAHSLILGWMLILPKYRPRDVPLKWPLLGLALATLISLVLHAAILSDMLAFFTKPSTPAQAAQVTKTAEWTSPWWTIKAVAQSLGFGLVPGLLAIAMALGLLGLGCASYAKRDWKLPLLFLLPGILGGGLMLALGRNLWPRFFFFLAGFVLMIIARAVGVLSDLLAKGRRNNQLFAAGGALGLVAFLVILPRALLLPKQDFEGALAWVQKNRGAGQPVLTAGLTQLPYSRYHRTDFLPVNTPDQLKTGALVLHTLPAFLDSKRPALAEALKQRGRERARFPGSVGAGDVVVYQIE